MMPKHSAETPTEFEIAEGARNLLSACAGIKAGDTVLLVGEEGRGAFFHRKILEPVVKTAKLMGAACRQIVVRDPARPDAFSPDLMEAMDSCDHTIFFSRLGDRIRFAPAAGRSKKTMCYVHNFGYLGSGYGRLPFALFEEVSSALLSAMAEAKSCEIRCPLGTRIVTNSEPPQLAADFTLKQFPVLITPPMSCAGMGGRLALSRFLISTSTNAYDGALLTFEDTVFAIADGGRIVDFEGPERSLAPIRRHFERVATLIGGDPFALNSWHTGIYPPTYFEGRASDDIERWGDIAFGSPRYTHLHACGTNPGDVCISLFDTTVTFDGEAFWDKGRFSFLDLPAGQAILKRYPNIDPAWLESGDIGI